MHARTLGDPERRAGGTYRLLLPAWHSLLLWGAVWEWQQASTGRLSVGADEWWALGGHVLGCAPHPSLSTPSRRTSSLLTSSCMPPPCNVQRRCCMGAPPPYSFAVVTHPPPTHFYTYTMQCRCCMGARAWRLCWALLPPSGKSLGAGWGHPSQGCSSVGVGWAGCAAPSASGVSVAAPPTSKHAVCQASSSSLLVPTTHPIRESVQRRCSGECEQHTSANNTHTQCTHAALQAWGLKASSATPTTLQPRHLALRALRRALITSWVWLCMCACACDSMCLRTCVRDLCACPYGWVFAYVRVCMHACMHAGVSGWVGEVMCGGCKAPPRPHPSRRTNTPPHAQCHDPCMQASLQACAEQAKDVPRAVKGSPQDPWQHQAGYGGLFLQVRGPPPKKEREGKKQRKDRAGRQGAAPPTGGGEGGGGGGRLQGRKACAGGPPSMSAEGGVQGCVLGEKRGALAGGQGCWCVLWEKEVRVLALCGAAVACGRRRAAAWTHSLQQR